LLYCCVLQGYAHALVTFLGAESPTLNEERIQVLNQFLRASEDARSRAHIEDRARTLQRVLFCCAVIRPLLFSSPDPLDSITTDRASSAGNLPFDFAECEDVRAARLAWHGDLVLHFSGVTFSEIEDALYEGEESLHVTMTEHSMIGSCDAAAEFEGAVLKAQRTGIDLAQRLVSNAKFFNLGSYNSGYEIGRLFFLLLSTRNISSSVLLEFMNGLKGVG
jgi:hypothetical protein